MDVTEKNSFKLKRIKSQLWILVVVLTSVLWAGCSDREEQAQALFNDGYSGDCLDSAVKNHFIVRWKDGRITGVKAKDKEDLLEHFVIKNLKHISYVEHDYWVKMYKSNSSLVELGENPQINNWGIRYTNAKESWAQNIRGEGIIVAVIDTAVDINHESLKNQIAYNEGESGEKATNGIDDDGNGFVDDYAGYDFSPPTEEGTVPGSHGTHVAGIIAAEHNDQEYNDTYVQGIAPGAKILPVSFLNEQGGRLSGAIAAIEYSVLAGAKIINASWGGDLCSQNLRQVIAELHEKGVLFVAAAGNSSSNIDQLPEYPAAFDSVAQITVGSVSTYGEMAYHSNYGFESVDLFAPGYDIISTTPNNTIQSKDGTSMATPFVSGAIALLWSAHPEMSLDRIKQALFEGTEDHGYPSVTRGRLNVADSLKVLFSFK